MIMLYCRTIVLCRFNYKFHDHVDDYLYKLQNGTLLENNIIPTTIKISLYLELRFADI